MPCGGPKKSPRTSSIAQIIFSVLSFEIMDRIWGNQKVYIGLDSFYIQFLNVGLNLVYFGLCVDCLIKNVQNYSTFLWLFSPDFEGH